jgi:hypothetical protein
MGQICRPLAAARNLARHSLGAARRLRMIGMDQMALDVLLTLLVPLVLYLLMP